MRGLPPRLHLPYEQWPADDRRLWAAAMDSSDDDPFCDAPGARLADATRRRYMFGWRRFLGFLAIGEPVALEAAVADRLTIARVRSYVAHLPVDKSLRRARACPDFRMTLIGLRPVDGRRKGTAPPLPESIRD